MQTLTLHLVPLSAEAFAPYGDVIDRAGQSGFRINDGMAERFHDLAQIDVNADGGRPIISILAAKPHTFPFLVRFVQRTPLSSQAFIPLTSHPFVAIVAETRADGTPGRLTAFISDGRQGINYRPGAWHHTLVMPDDEGEFLVIDRAGPGKNSNEFWFSEDARPLLLR